ncbi:rhodanese-like domain-containing protein [Glaciecola sp. MH2013]|uniref:rhodanese-like domain-containing protein n=1 Tax=Glaciecola sp. MH2013 TaxID=2785524 RepID=UPI00189D43FE|nr:rhodanese-like domain-containing protein [Glaciecola sp. MH2013]MBF7074119.1 rhodanese-like domain-containing protein [Glaciecola sp. MH2013]
MRAIKAILSVALLGAALLVTSAFAKDISADEFLKIDKTERILLDVRTPKEYADGHIPTAMNIPVGDLEDMFSKLSDKDQQIVVYCRSGFRAGRAIDFLKEQGYTNLVHLDGDFGEWEKQGREIVKPE